MTEEKGNEKIIVSSQLKFPFDVYIVCTVFIVIVAFLLKQILFKIFIQTEWLFLLLISVTTFGLLILMFREQYKKVRIYNHKIEIKPIFSFRSQTVYFEDLKGFELFETLYMRGYVTTIRLISKLDDDFVIHRDNYDNYEEIIDRLKLSKLQFLGLNEVQEKYKSRYGKLLKWSAIVYPFIYGLTLLLKGSLIFLKTIK